MTWNAVMAFGASAVSRFVLETLSASLNFTMPRAPVLMVVRPLTGLTVPFDAMPSLVFAETAKVRSLPTNAAAWKFECVTWIVTVPLTVVEAAAKFESVPLRMYMTLGAALLWLVGAGGLAASATLGSVSATMTNASVLLIVLLLSPVERR